MMGGIVPAGGRLGGYGMQALRTGGRATGAGLYGLGQGAAHIGAAAAAGNHTPAVLGLAGAAVAAQGAGAVVGGIGTAAAAVAGSAEMLAAGALVGGGIAGAGLVMREGQEQYERWQRRRIAQGAIGPDPVPVAPPVPVDPAGPAAPARPAAHRIIGVPAPAPAVPVPAPAAAPAAADPAADPGAVAADAFHLRTGHVPRAGSMNWYRTNRQPAHPEFWWHIRFTDAGGRVQNFWQHRGGPDLTASERAYLVDDA